MIFKRITNDVAKRFPRIPGQCRYCKTPLKNKRLSWCGGWTDKGGCYDKAQAEGNWTRVREYIYKRDEGRCALCRFDITQMEKDLHHYNQEARKHTERKFDFSEASRQTKRYAFTMYGARARNWPNDCWAVDHILPISEGGECLDHANLRLLDLVCHDKVTAELRGRLAERKRRHRFLPLFR